MGSLFVLLWKNLLSRRVWIIREQLRIVVVAYIDAPITYASGKPARVV